MITLLVATLLAGCSLLPHRPASTTTETLPPAARTVSSTAEAMVGVPYRYGGSSPQGFDCSGLVFYAYARAGINVPRRAEDQWAQSQPIDRDELRPGDLLFFRTGWFQEHVGIYVGKDEFIHAPSSGKRVTRGTIRSGYFAGRLRKTGRFVAP